MRGGVEAGLRIGLGKQQQDDFYTAADNVSRRQLEVELQACEPEERTRRREVPHTFFLLFCRSRLEIKVLMMHATVSANPTWVRPCFAKSRHPQHASVARQSLRDMLCDFAWLGDHGACMP